jgi:hypothetical protein
MIKGIQSKSPHLLVNHSTSVPYISPGEGSGMVRWNSNKQCLEISNGPHWIQYILNNAEINLSQEAEAAILWYLKKMHEDFIIEKLSKENEAVKIAYENVLKAKAQLKATILLSKEHEPKN